MYKPAERTISRKSDSATFGLSHAIIIKMYPSYGNILQFTDDGIDNIKKLHRKKKTVTITTVSSLITAAEKNIQGGSKK